MLRLNLYQRYLIRETFAAVFLVLAAFLALLLSSTETLDSEVLLILN